MPVVKTSLEYYCIFLNIFDLLDAFQVKSTIPFCKVPFTRRKEYDSRRK